MQRQSIHTGRMYPTFASTDAGTFTIHYDEEQAEYYARIYNCFGYLEQATKYFIREESLKYWLKKHYPRKTQDR